MIRSNRSWRFADFSCFEAGAHLGLADDVLLRRVHCQRRALFRPDLLDEGRRFAEADLLDSLAEARADFLLEFVREVEIEPLRLTDLAAEVLLGVAELPDLDLCHLEGLEERLLRDLLRARLDHREGVLRPHDDEVERCLLNLGQRRVEDELAVDHAHPDGPDGAEEGQWRDHQRSRGSVEAENVVRRDQVRRERRADDLNLVREALRPERPDGAVDHACGEDRLLGRAPLSLEEASGDLPGGIHPLLDVHGEREEVRALPRLRAALRCREDHRFSTSDKNRSIGLLGQVPRLEDHLLPAHGHVDRRLVGNHHAHVVPPSFLTREAEAEV
jgi:hypothetical protein